MENVQTKFINQEKLPFVIEPERSISFDAFLEALRENREAIHKNTLEFGGVLFRGFPVEGAEGFNAVVDALDFGKPLNYIGGDTPRDKVKGQVYTSTEAPPSFKIPLHNEMSFIKNYPKHIYFYCDIPPTSGGETIIGDARSIYRAVDQAVKERFVERELKYLSNYYGKSWVLDTINRFQRAHKTWMNVFETDDKKKVERHCLENAFKFQWNRKEWLQISQYCPAVIAHPETGERVWFNQAHLYDYSPKLLGFWNWLGTKIIYMRKNTVMHEIHFGNGAKVPRNDLYHIMDVLDEQTIKFPWQKGDFLVLDNVLAMHGRAPFTGKRRILAALTR